MTSPINLLVSLIGYAVHAAQIIILIDVISSWIPSMRNRHPLMTIVHNISNILCSPIRQLIPPGKTGFIDISPALTILALLLVGGLIQNILVSIAGPTTLVK
ncbi:MAG: YggT family protein [Armatimonadota bacterium]